VTALLLCWVVFPLVMAALSLGCGLLLQQISRTALPGALLPTAGFAVVLVAAHIATAWSATAELAIPAVLALAVSGYALSLPVRKRRIDGWALGSACAVYAVFAAPIVLSGAATFAGYIKLDDTATWLAMTDRLLDHGRNLDGLAPSSYEATLDVNLTSGYPVGAFPPLGIGARLVGQDPAWVFQPYLALLAALMASALYVAVTRVVDSRWQRALCAFVASQSALLFAYGLWGGVKELAAAWAIALLAALVLPLLRERLTATSVLPIACASAALLAVLSFGGIIWLAPVLAPAAFLLVRLRGADGALVAGLAFVVLAALLSIPSLLQAEVFLRPASGALTSETELGNLIEPLSRLQLAGIWPVGDFRLEPDDLAPTYVLIVVLVAAALLGVAWAWRRRAWEMLLYVLAAVGGALAISFFGSPWVGAKALASGSPAIVLAGLVGAAALARRGRGIEAAVVGLAIAGGVIWSNVLAYHEVYLAPRDRHVELEEIGDSIEREGPTLMTEYEPYGVRHFLREGDAEGASELRRRVVPLRRGGALDKLEVADVDELALEGLLVYRTLVLRRSPVASRPPSIYARIRSDRFYDVWQRGPGSEGVVLDHLSLGDATRASARARCADVLRLGRVAARAGGRLAVARRPRPATVPLFPPPGSDWTPDPGTREAVVPSGSGLVRTDLVVSAAGRYEIFIRGSFPGRLRLTIDGREVSSERHLLSHAGNYEPLGTVSLGPGRHAVTLAHDEPAPAPGSGGAPFAIGPLLFAPLSPQAVELLSPSRATSLCDQSLDWVEAVAL
jgi:hypothetical protein